MNPTGNFPSYLLPSVFNPRYHEHLNHLNDMAFTHTKLLQEIIEKRSNESSSASSSSSVSPLAATSNDSIHQQKRSHSSIDTNNNEEQMGKDFLSKRSKIDVEEDENHFNKRSRKQPKPQQLVQESHPTDDESSEHGEILDDDEEQEIGEIPRRDEKQNSQATLPPLAPFFPLSTNQNLPFLSYIQDLARANNITSPPAISRFIENLQKELFSAAHTATFDPKRLPPSAVGPLASLPVFSQTVHHHHHPYFSQVLFNNSFVHHYQPQPTVTGPGAPFLRLGNLPTDRNFPFHLSTPKKRRTKVTDTRLSPRITSKVIHHDDLIDDEKSSSNHSFDSNQSNGNQQQSLPSMASMASSSNGAMTEFNAFQVTVLTSLHLRKAKLMFFYTRYPSSSVLKVYFPDVRFNKLITAQLVKWFSNFREFFYIQIEKYARQYLAEGVRHVEDLVINPESDLYRVLNLHYNRSNQIDVPLSFSEVVQATLREFFLAIQQQKDLEPSWKKSIYKIIQRLDDQIPEFFKDERWMHSI